MEEEVYEQISFDDLGVPYVRDASIVSIDLKQQESGEDCELKK